MKRKVNFDTLCILNLFEIMKYYITVPKIGCLTKMIIYYFNIINYKSYVINNYKPIQAIN